ncbi:glycosyltransferase family 4 protein [Rhizorhabdus dicambivorans]|uniref:glycosyltransferase family 4 protein n=1 Tax=Rhizorhabdus dicambivorans TaxID=1850238 RepID=UPI0008355946|nr:glycosyltransferase family 4 protein [Rhizorhabdus dicambivorans]
MFDRLGARPDFQISVHAIEQHGEAGARPDVAGVIRQSLPDDYVRAAREINAAAYDAVWIQHEFGIFGGPDGEMVCDFADRIAAPIILTFHTVLSAPSPRQRAIVEHLISRASRIMVMSQQGRETLIGQYRAPAAIVETIAHGAPDRPFGREAEFKARFRLGDQPILMTFGLIGPGKGLEHMIEALPAIVARHPRALYRIVGATHPNLIAEEGERYRESLQQLARSLGVEDHVAWENRFLDTEELLDQLEACDIYVTPYANLQQATSGTLSYAVALGKAVVATPYVHARELLAGGVGLIVEPQSSRALAEAVNGLLDDPERLTATKERAYAAGRRTIWPEFANASAALVRRAIRPRGREVRMGARPGLSGVWTMSDGCGMLQHSIGMVPDRRHGYCLDDNVRALMLMNIVPDLAHEERMRWSLVYASFIQHAWNPDARRFRNFMAFDRSWCEEVGSEDSNGRAIWALGQTAALAPDRELRRWALRWFDETSTIAETLRPPRSTAFAMLGAAAVLRTVHDHLRAAHILDRGGAMLFDLLQHSRRPGWTWFEARLAYDNPRLCQALIEAGLERRRPEWVEAGLEALRWLADRQTAREGHFRPVGSEGFGSDYEQLPFDQQPLEAQAAIEAACAAFEANDDPAWIDHALTAYCWYLGVNDRGVVLADVASGRCRDGITPRGANENMGAESILAFQLSHYAVLTLNRSALPDARPEDDAEAEPRDTAHPPAFA